VSDPKPYCHRFLMTIIRHPVWLYPRFPFSDRDVRDLLHQRDIKVSQETLRQWCINFSPMFVEELRPRGPRWGSRGHLDEVCTPVDGVRHWVWMAVDEYGFVQGGRLQRHRSSERRRPS